MTHVYSKPKKTNLFKNFKPIYQSLILIALVALLGLSFSNEISASHIYGGQLSYTQGTDPGEVCFTFVEYLNYGSQNVGDSFSHGISTGDGGNVTLNGTVTAINPADDYFEATTSGCYTYDCSAGDGNDCSAETSFTAQYDTCCKINGLGPNSSDDIILAIEVQPCSDNNSPVTSLPPYISLPLCEVNDPAGSTFTIPYADPDGDAVICALEPFPDPDSSQPTGLSLVPGTCDLVFQDGAATAGQLFNAYVCGDDGCSKTCFDFTIEIVNCACPVVDPTFSQPVTTNYSVCEGEDINFNIAAADANGDDINLFAVGVPAGSNLTLTNNNTAAPTGTFAWNTTFGDAGTYVMTLLADNGCGNDQVVVNLEVLPLTEHIILGEVFACPDEAVNLTVTNDGVNAGAYTTVTWTGDTGGLSSTASATPTFSSATPGTYNLLVETVGGTVCGGEGMISIIVEEPPAAPTAVNLDVCEGGDVSGGISATCGDSTSDGIAVVTTTCGDGSATYDVSNNAWTLISNNAGGGSACDVTVCFTQASAVNCSFDWSYSTLDDSAVYDPFLYSINGIETTVISSSTTGSGTVSISLNAGDTFCLIQRSTDGIFGAATSVVMTDCGGTTSASNLLWYDAATGGTLQGNTNPLDPTGLDAEEGAFDVDSPGTYTFYAVCESENGCESPATPVTVTVWPEVSATSSYPDAPAECRVELVLSDPSFEVAWTATDDIEGALSGDETSGAMTATATGYIWDANIAYGGIASFGDVSFTITNPNAPATLDGACQEFVLGPIDYLCCVTSSGEIAGPAFDYTLCEGESISSAFGGTLTIANQNPATVSLEPSVYASGFILVDSNTGLVSSWTPGTGPVDYSPAVGCYEVYAYNYNLSTGEAGADLVGQNIADIQAGLFTDPQPVSGPGGGDGANCASLSNLGATISVYPALQISASTSDYNGYGVSCNINASFCDNPATPYSCINDGFIELTITGGTGDAAADCGSGVVDYNIIVTDGFGTEVFNGPGGAGGAVVLADDGGFGLLAGIYTIDVVDAAGCEVSTTVNVTEPQVISCSAIAADVSCPDGDIDGNVIFTFDGGVSDPALGGYLVAFFEGTAATGYTQLPPPPNGPTSLIGQAGLPIDYITQFGEGVDGGDYMVQVLDGNGCACQANVVVEVPEPLVVECGGNGSEGFNGNLTPFWYNTHQITISGGTGPYSIDMDKEGYVTWAIQNQSANGADVTINYADNAEWCVSIIDANGCTVDATAFDCCNDDGSGVGSIPGADGDILDIDAVTIGGESGVNNDDGSIELTIAGCSDAGGPTYEWSGTNGYTSTDAVATDLGSGLYYVTVTCDGEMTTGWYWVPLDRSGGRFKIAGDADLHIESFPNPFSHQTTLSFSVMNEGLASVQLFTVDGKLIEEIFKQEVNTSSTYYVDLSSEGLSNGTYIAVITDAHGERAMNKVVLIK